jgi:hypothetical protein
MVDKDKYNQGKYNILRIPNKYQIRVRIKVLLEEYPIYESSKDKHCIKEE